VGLDIGITNSACKKFLNGKMANPCIDTLRLSQVYKEEQWGNYYDQFNLKVSYNLADLTKEYGLPVFTSHDAIQDAIQTAYLFLFMVKKLRSGGLITLKDLYMAGRSWRWIF
jgi:DNA polymerase-3 subunit epsilon